MNCSQVQNLLSAYYDGELAGDLQTRVARHLGECTACAQQLTGFEKLTALAGALPTPAPPESIWRQLNEQLDEQRANQSPEHRSRLSFPIPRILTLVATVLIAAGIGWFGYQAWFAPTHDEQFVAEFGRYLELFGRDPEAAEQFLLAKYEGQAVNVQEAADIEQAVERLGYRPVVADGLPQGYSIESTTVMDMPCCTCVNCRCKRSDGSTIAIFEHNDEEADWFGERPVISANCSGRRCRLVELDGRIAATWRRGQRMVTVIGLKDVTEVNTLVAWLDEKNSRNRL